MHITADVIWTKTTWWNKRAKYNVSMSQSILPIPHSDPYQIQQLEEQKPMPGYWMSKEIDMLSGRAIIPHLRTNIMIRVVTSVTFSSWVSPECFSWHGYTRASHTWSLETAGQHRNLRDHSGHLMVIVTMKFIEIARVSCEYF